MNNINMVRGGAGDITRPEAGTRIQDNLYLAVNSEWLDKTKIPSDRSRIASFSQIDINVEKHLMSDFADFAAGKKQIPDIPNVNKAVKLYQIARNFDKRNSEGAAPIKEDLARLEGIHNYEEFTLKAADLFKAGFNLPFNFFVEVDMKNTKKNMLLFTGPDLFLPDTTTYKTPDANALLDILKKQSLNLFKMAGVDEEAANDYVKNALEFDKKLSTIVKSAEEWADAPAMYNPVATNEFIDQINNFKMGNFFDQILSQRPDQVVNAEPRFLENFNELIKEDNFNEIKGWMLVKFINGAASYLSQDFREAAFPFSQALSGQKELASGEKQAYRITDSAFSEVVGVYYGQTYFGEEAKKDVVDMINKMLDVYEQRISNNDWLSEATKKKAIVKLRALILKIGYPEKIEEIYNRLHVDDISLYANMRNISTENRRYNLEKLQKPVDRTEWAMPGNLVNACYDPQRNDLTFPAAILQAPFYDLKQDRAENFGGIGTVIAHEISHAFDNNGAQFDEFGNMKNWWTDEDYAEFKKRTQAEIELFDGIKYGPVTLNGRQIVSENIADQGGLTAAVTAAKNEGDDLKELFTNFARIWAIKQYPESIKSLTAIDVHAPGPERANVQSQCQDDFYEVFDVKPEDGMWLDPDKRVRIW